MSGEGILAQQSGVCPLCARFIAKGRSRVLRLPTPIVPRGDGTRSADDGRFYYTDGRKISTHARAWCHVKCWPRRLRPPKYLLPDGGFEDGYRRGRADGYREAAAEVVPGEVLRALVQLCHPDRHPPERARLAHEAMVWINTQGGAK